MIWVRKKTEVPTMRFSSAAKAEQFLKRNQTSAVGLFKIFEGISYEEFVKVAVEDNDVQFVEVNKVMDKVALALVDLAELSSSGDHKKLGESIANVLLQDCASPQETL